MTTPAMTSPTSPTSPPSTFAAALRRHRISAQLTQAELADRSGLSVEGISLLERGGRRAPRRDTVTLLSAALCLSGPDAAHLLRLATDARHVAGCHPVAHRQAQPAPHRGFVGREKEVGGIVAAVTEPDPAPGSRIVVIDGIAGIGKSALADEVVRRVEGSTGRVTVLDAGVDAVEVLAPAPGRAVIVTTRAPFAGACLTGPVHSLVHHVRLGPLDPGDAARLLESLVGTDRTREDPAASAALLQRCEGLPQLVVLAARRLLTRPAWPIRHLVNRIDGLGWLPDATGVDPVLVAQLRDAVDAVAGININSDTDPERLVDSGLAQTPAPGVYRVHPLVAALSSEGERPDVTGIPGLATVTPLRSTARRRALA